MTWTEDRALLGEHPEARSRGQDRNGVGAVPKGSAPLLPRADGYCGHSGIGRDAINPRGTMPRSLWDTTSEPY